jgi:hypothetical protein
MEAYLDRLLPGVDIEGATATYAIGDVQDCFDDLLRLLDRNQLDPASEDLWFTGDRVKREAQPPGSRALRQGPGRQRRHGPR